MTRTAPDGLPALIRRAGELATANGFPNSCTPRTGKLLRTLAARAEGQVLELGTGYGVGSAWLLSGLRDGGRLLSIDLDGERQQTVAECFSRVENAEFIQGDWREALRRGPFDLVFVDVGPAKDRGAEDIIDAVSIGGSIILDDFTPGPLFEGQHDERWHTWMEHPRLISCEVLTGDNEAAIIATRVN